MRQLIIEKQFPPTTFMRYCCAELKERSGAGRLVMTGVRWAESRNRRANQGRITVFQAKGLASASFQATPRGGLVLNDDNDESRRLVEACYRTHKTLINPVIDWEDDDVWAFIRAYNVPYCELYDEGFQRLGCIGCPLSGPRQQRVAFARWPLYKKLYIHAFDDMLAARRASGKSEHTCVWRNGEEVFNWWTTRAARPLPGQIAIDDI